MSWTLALVGAVHVVTAAAFLAVGERFRRRPVDAAMAWPRNAFVAWWWGFAAYLLLQGTMDLAGAAGRAHLPTFVVLRVATGPLLAAAAAGLAFHVLYLWSGRRWLALPLAFYYGAAGALYSVSILQHDPVAVAVTPWTAELAYAQPLGGPVWDAVLASFGLPLALGSLAYVALARKAVEREQRYRILLVGSSIFAWVVSGYAAEVAGGHAVRFFAIVLFGLVTSAAVTVAHFPPAPVRRWLQRSAG